MTERCKEETEEEKRRRFLLRALSIDDDDEKTKPDTFQDADREPNRTQIPCDTRELRTPIHSGEKFKRGRRYTQLTRISQLDTWDCGIACMLMIASWLRDGCEFDNPDDREGTKDPYAIRECETNRSLERKKLLEKVGTESIWTSDLMRELQSWKTRRWCTKESLATETSLLACSSSPRIEQNFLFVLASRQVVGADESYRDFQYYQNAFEEDQSRVARTFRDLHFQSVPMLQTTAYGDEQRGRGLSISTVIDIVEREDCIAIVLLDNCLLLGATTQKLSSRNAAPKAGHNECGGGGETSRSPYAGHYVILCGTSNDPRHVELANSGEKRDPLQPDPDEKKRGFCFVLCNPDPSSVLSTRLADGGSSSNYMFVTPSRLEASWRAQGTDEDIIFLRKPKPKETRQSRISGCVSPSKRIVVDGTENEHSIDDRAERNDHFLGRIDTLVRENYLALTRLLWALCKHNFPPFQRH